ncbi:Uncharacterized protein APZ42_016626 [Daphnia magna]|uniref:Uncharacterized protein n=1 Tax=Daphnia magna TaxID=35525 RepID=A0A165ABS7_9CRUS|nr:Uncharacterized protein APZ42_016626 [Daphnia magna]
MVFLLSKRSCANVTFSGEGSRTLNERAGTVAKRSENEMSQFDPFSWCVSDPFR